jgi:hypothetical protein
VLARELRKAFVDYGKSARWRWKIRIYSLSPVKNGLSPAVPRVVRVDLTSDDARVLADLLNAATEPETGVPPRGPIGAWMGTEDVAARIGVQPSTIRGWVTRHGPKTHPFPAPDEKYRGRNYWKKATADGWKAEQDGRDEQRRQKRAAHRPAGRPPAVTPPADWRVP